MCPEKGWDLKFWLLSLALQNGPTATVHKPPLFVGGPVPRQVLR